MTPNGWQSRAVMDLAPTGGVAGGPFGSSLVWKDYVPAGVPVIRGVNLAGDQRFCIDDIVFVKPEKVDTQLRRNTAEPGDIVLTQRGTLGQVGIVPDSPFERYVISQSQMRLRVDKSLADRNFVYAVFRGPRMMRQIEDRAISTGVPHINLGILRELELDLPPLPEQRAIARVLGSLDDKVELNRRMAKTLEEIAQAIFKSWFVDFDGVEEFEDSEIGPVPRGWEVRPLGELAPINEATLRPKQAPTNIRYIDISSVKPRLIEEIRSLAFKDAPSRARRVVRSGDTIVSTVRPERRSMALVYEAEDGMIASTGFAVLTPKQAPSTLVYRFSTSKDCIDHLSSNVGGSAYPAVNPTILADYRVPVPPDQGDRYDELARPLEELRWQLLQENRTLAQLRDTLLPKLISGEVRVPIRPEDEEPAPA